MHTHLLSDGAIIRISIAETSCHVMVANGVTTVRFYDWDAGTVDFKSKSGERRNRCADNLFGKPTSRPEKSKAIISS